MSESSKKKSSHGAGAVKKAEETGFMHVLSPFEEMERMAEKIFPAGMNALLRWPHSLRGDWEVPFGRELLPRLFHPHDRFAG